MSNNTESALTAPSARDRQNKWRPDNTTTPLSKEELTEALEDLTVKPKKYPVFERVYIDPPLPMQNIALVSFVPSQGASPDKDGFYGMAKVRGVFNTVNEADQRARDLIQNVDSYHKIFFARVGQPFPFTTSSEHSAESSEVDVKNKGKQIISEDVKQKRKEEQEEIREIKQREENLKQDVSKDQDPLDRYTTLQVKRAQVSWTYLETQKKMEEMKKIIIKTRGEIAEMDEESDTYLKQFYQKYLDARKDAGLETKENPNDDDSFMKFLVKDAPLDF